MTQDQEAPPEPITSNAIDEHIDEMLAEMRSPQVRDVFADRPGGREWALAITNFEQGLLWVRRSVELYNASLPQGDGSGESD